jgi:hypothetical protein
MGKNKNKKLLSWGTQNIPVIPGKIYLPFMYVSLQRIILSSFSLVEFYTAEGDGRGHA